MEDGWKVRMNICTALWSFVNFCSLSQSEVSTDNRKVSTFFAFQHVRCRCCYRSYRDCFLKDYAWLHLMIAGDSWKIGFFLFFFSCLDIEHVGFWKSWLCLFKMFCVQCFGWGCWAFTSYEVPIVQWNFFYFHFFFLKERRKGVVVGL